MEWDMTLHLVMTLLLLISLAAWVMKRSAG